MKANDIPDERIYEIVAAARHCGKPFSALTCDFQAAMPEIPWKIVAAKLTQMVNKGRLRGCPCGCRGDFRFPWEEFGDESAASRDNWRERLCEYLASGKRRYGY